MADAAQMMGRIASRLARVRRHAIRETEADLKGAGLPQVAWCEILFELARRGGRAAPGSIERRLVLEQYNLSRILDRMEARNLVRRVPHPTDGRRQIVELTEEGARVRDRAAPLCAGTMQRLAQPLSAKQAAKLSDLLGRLLPARGAKAAAKSVPADVQK